MKAAAIAIVLLVASLVGCATEPISASAARPVSMDNHLLYSYERANTVPVTIVRDEGFLGGGCAARVLVNDQVAAYVRAGEKVTLHMTPGEYILGADIQTEGLCGLNSQISAEIEANVQLRRPIRFRIGVAQDGAVRLMRAVDR